MLVVTPFPIQIGAVVRCAIGVLEMDDESGGDAKLLAVPIEKLYPVPQHQVLRRSADGRHLPHPALLRALQGPGKGQVGQVKGWKGVAAAHEEILKSAERHNKA